MSRSKRWVYKGAETFRNKRKASMRNDITGGSWLPGWGRVERRIISGQRRAERRRQAEAEVALESAVCKGGCEYAMDVGMPEYAMSPLPEGCGNCSHYLAGVDGAGPNRED